VLKFIYTRLKILRAVRRSNCFHKHGHAVKCQTSNNPYMIIFACIQIMLSQIPNFHKLSWLSILAAVMSFAYASIGLGLSLAKVIGNNTIPSNTWIKKHWISLPIQYFSCRALIKSNICVLILIDLFWMEYIYIYIWRRRACKDKLNRSNSWGGRVSTTESLEDLPSPWGHCLCVCLLYCAHRDTGKPILLFSKLLELSYVQSIIHHSTCKRTSTSTQHDD
jgi:hypothetical protein